MNAALPTHHECAIMVRFAALPNCAASIARTSETIRLFDAVLRVELAWGACASPDLS